MIAPSAMQAPRWASRSPFTAARTRTRVVLGEDMSHPTWRGPSQVVAIARRVLADLMNDSRPAARGVNGAPCGVVAPIIHGARVQLV